MTERLITAAEVGEYLGVATGTILDWWESGRLPGFKLGRAVRFRLSEVDAWLEAQRGGPPSPAPLAVTAERSYVQGQAVNLEHGEGN